MNQKLMGRIFPFIPLSIGFLLVIFQMRWGESDPQLPIEMMFVIIISCMISWLFSTAGLLIYKDCLFMYYQKLFKILSAIYLLPAVILALFIPWTLFFALAVFLSGIILIKKNNPQT